MSRAQLLLITILAGPLCAACSHGNTPAGTFPVANDGGLIEANEGAIRDFVVGGGTRDWVREATPHASAGPHGRVQTAFNDAYLAARHADHYPMPIGATAAKEIFHDDGSHQGWAVGIKIAGGVSGDTWVWWEADAPDYNSKGYGIGVYSCDRCHGDSNHDHSLTATVP